MGTTLLVVLLAGCGSDAPQTGADPDTKQTPDNATRAAIQAPAKQTSTNPFSTAIRSESGAYRVRLRPQDATIQIGEAQAWIATISAANGQPFTPNALYFDGGMPGHGHGLPSAPEFTRHLGGAEFLLEGLTLNMPGDWRFVVTVGGPAGLDSAVFEMNLQPGAIGADKQPPSSSDRAGALVNSLRLDGLAAPKDNSNQFMNNPTAIKLGEALFADPGLSATGEVSCATCHQAQLAFADGKTLGFGSKTTARHTPALLGVAHARWFYWDGRRDSLWAQALTPIETPGEMDNTRTRAVRYVYSNAKYLQALGKLDPTLAAATSEAAEEVTLEVRDSHRFPPAASPFGRGKVAWYRMDDADQLLVNKRFVLIGKVLAAYETTLQHQPGRFDAWLAGTTELTTDEQAGLDLFLDLPKTQCLRCHNGPLLTNQGFHNVATSESVTTPPARAGTHDFGRMLGLQAVIVDPFNCSGEFSDAPASDCEHLRFARRQNLGEAIDGAFKVPSLRNLSASAPYFHDGRFASLEAVIDHYRNQNGAFVSRVSEVPDIKLTDQERDQLVAFLTSLDPM